ncbi:MAG: hypothetical protein ACRDQU_00895 [Pseudonocardiaceae bacterium]
MDTMGLSGTHEIRTVPDLLHAIDKARGDEDRLRISNRAHYLGLGHKLPSNWNPDGSLRGEAPTDD